MKWILVLLLLTACAQGPVCNPPYIIHGMDCCLDTDNNSICDEDDNLTTENMVVEEKPTLEETAELFAKYLEEEKIEEIYDMMTEHYQSLISVEQFYELYPISVYGTRSTIVDDEFAVKKTADNPYLKVFIEDKKIENNTGYVWYAITDLTGVTETSDPFKFKMEDEWKAEPFPVLVKASCYETEECRPELMEDVCWETCDEVRTLPLKEEESYMCKDNVCHCRCFEKNTEVSYTIPPEFQ